MTKKDIPQQIQSLINHFNAKNFDHVILKGKTLIKKNPEYVILYNLIGSAYQSTGEYEKAKENFVNGLKLDTKNIALMNNLAMSYKNLLQYDMAQELYLKLISINDKYINAYINFGNLKRDLNEFSESIKLYEKALSINEKNPTTNYLLALANQGIGNFEKAILYSEKALKYDKNFTRADHLISQSIKYDNNNKHYHNLKDKLYSAELKNLEKIDIFFSLAKAEEDMNNIQESSSYLLKGNKLKNESINYDISLDINLLEDIKKKFNEYKNTDFNSDKDENIIFILGMPRSGTSLVEQIITSHSEVFGGGELPILSNIIKNNFIEDDKLLNNDFKKKMEDPLIITKLKKDYYEFIKFFNYKEKYITDKAPLNFRWIGFIKHLFPGAKIIHCKREPKNNCLSMFKNLFEGGLNFTYSQENLVKYYNHYLDLMSFWKFKYQSSIFDVEYENLIKNNKDEIQKIISFCGLKWEENCLNFHKNKNPIKTMSTAQARKPIYKSSLNTFEKYKEYLKVIEKNL